MDNPIVDIIRNYSTIYNKQVASATLLDNGLNTNNELYYEVFAALVDDDEARRLDSVYLAAEDLLDELFSLLNTEHELFEKFNVLNDKYNEAIKSSMDVSKYSEEFLTLSDSLKESIDKIDALFMSYEQYNTVIEASITTLQQKYSKEYEEYIVKQNENTDSSSNDATERAAEIFDPLNTTNEAMFADTSINRAFAAASEFAEPNVLTESEMLAYSQGIVTCEDYKKEIYTLYSDMCKQYGGSDLLNQNLALVNNFLKECDNVKNIFVAAVENPKCWNFVQDAQSTVYRYEALQNDIKVVKDALSSILTRLKDGSARRAGSLGRSIPLELKIDENVNYQQLQVLVYGLKEDIETYFNNPACNEIIKAWVVSRYDDVIYYANNFVDALKGISVESMPNGGFWQLAIYGNEGMFPPMVGNWMRECNLAATEIRNVIGKTSKI